MFASKGEPVLSPSYALTETESGLFSACPKDVDEVRCRSEIIIDTKSVLGGSMIHVQSKYSWYLIVNLGEVIVPVKED